MKIACGSICFADRDLEGMLKGVKEAGYEWVEVIVIPGWIHADLREMKPEALGERIAAHGLGLAAFYASSVKTGSHEKMLESVEYISLVIAAAAALGVGNVVLSGERRDTGDRSLMIEGFKRLAERLTSVPTSLREPGSRLASGEVGSQPVNICLHNHMKNQVETPEDFESILSEVGSENFAMCPDTGCFTGSGVDGSVLIDRYPEKIRHMHLKDHVGTSPVRMGEGETPIRQYTQKLAKIGYKGFLTLEVEHEGRTTEDIIAAREYVEGLLRQL